MQKQLTRAARIGAVAIGSIGVLAAGAGVASAATIRQGTTTAYPTSSSTVVASGTAVGGPLSSAATFTSPTTTGSCSSGAIRATVGTNPASPVNLTTSTSPNSLRVDTCTDNNPNTDVNRIELSNTPTITATNTSGGGTLTIPSTVTFRVVLLNSGTLTPCNVVPVGPTAIVGTLTNSNASVAFNNIRVRTTATSGLCATEIGTSNTGTTGNSVFSATFGPLRTIPASGTGNLLGIFS